MPEITITLNSQPLTAKSSSDLLSLLKDQMIEDYRGMAVAVNGRVVPRDTWETYILQESDKVLVIKAAQGG